MHKVLLHVSSQSNDRLVSSFIALDENDINISISDFILREVQEKYPDSHWTVNAIKSIESEAGICFFKMRYCSLREGFFDVPGARPQQMIVVLQQDPITAALPMEDVHANPPMAERHGREEETASVDFIDAGQDDVLVPSETEEEQEDEEEEEDDQDDSTVPLDEEDQQATLEHEVIHIEDLSPPAKKTKTQATHRVVTPARSMEPGSMVKVLSNEDAWNILRNKFGFQFIEGRYSLPGGRIQFDSLVDLRNDLCKYGIPTEDAVVSATEEEISSIEVWVRFAIVKGLEDGEAISTDFWDDMKFMKAWSALGFTYSSGTYRVPVYDPISDTTNIIRFRSTRTAEVENYFARFGVSFPDDSNLDNEARLCIDLFFANQPMNSTAVAEAVNTL
ncbi:hypothetical protein HJC23_012584 [Cyclotella cryptica]|uniref:Uncharacterized protein n=1 Tax=Cyclotella cryptica TaxID=29204 RepID=A0ABD3NXU0_9STRA